MNNRAQGLDRAERVLRSAATKICSFFIGLFGLALVAIVAPAILFWLKTGHWQQPRSTAAVIEDFLELPPVRTGWVEIDKALLWFLGWPGDLTICLGLLALIITFWKAREDISGRG